MIILVFNEKVFHQRSPCGLGFNRAAISVNQPLIDMFISASLNSIHLLYIACRNLIRAGAEEKWFNATISEYISRVENEKLTADKVILVVMCIRAGYEYVRQIYFLHLTEYLYHHHLSSLIIKCHYNGWVSGFILYNRIYYKSKCLYRGKEKAASIIPISSKI